jgi:large subunit ribosomal protein L24
LKGDAVQTTLLGLAIAFIIALLSALIGPYFIDWSQFRPQFEAEASRIIGAPVRVGGALDARLLPTPSLRLQSVVVGGANDLGKVHADKLDVEFSLGSLMRGEWRATELTVNGVGLDLGLDRQGRIDWPASSGNANLGSLAIDRLNLTGRVALHDAASRSTLELTDIAFSGDVRALAGAIRGDGNFTWSGARYPFRVSSSPAGDGGGVKLHLSLDPGEQRTATDLDGVLTFEGRSPRFDGLLTLAGGNRGKTDTGSAAPWRIGAKLKADAARARLEQIEISYGADDVAMKFAGSADMRFGASPLLQASLSARQLDADKLLAKQTSGTEPAQWLSGLPALIAGHPATPVPTQIDVTAEQIMLGGRAVQDIDASLRSDSKSWTVERMAFRAPGSTQVSLQGAVAPSDSSAGFNGTLSLDSSDPNVFAAWLTGRSETAYRSQKPLRISGRVDLASDRVDIADLKAEIDGGAIAGRLAWSAHGAHDDSAFDAALTADRLDLDAAAGFVRALGVPQEQWPGRAQVSLNIADAVSSGQDLRPFAAKLGYDTKTATLEGLKIGSAGGVMVDGSGAFDRVENTGRLTLNAAAASADQLTGLLQPFAPAFVERIKASKEDAKGGAQLKLAVDLGKDSKDHDRTKASAALDINLPQLNGTIALTATPPAQAVQGFDVDTLTRNEFSANWKLSSPRGQTVLNLLGLDRVLVAASAPAQFEGTASGKWHDPLRVQTKLSSGDFNASIQGTVAPSVDQPKADVNLTVQRGNFAPLFNLAPTDPVARDANLSSRLTVAGSKLAFTGIDGAMAGARIRGRVSFTLGDENAVEGQLGMDTLDLSRGFGLIIGTAGGDADNPLGGGLLRGWRGKVEFQALRGTLPGGSELRPVSGVIKSDGQSLSFDGLKGGIGGGDVTGDIDAKQSPNGLALNARVQLAGVDGSALHYRALTMPAGQASMRMTLATQGRSRSALTGALSGGGSLTLESARIAGLDGKAIDAAIAASDSGKVANEDILRKNIEASLSAGHLDVGSAQIPFNIRDGRLSVAATTLQADGATAVVSGGYDVTADQTDMRVNLTSLSGEQATGRPAIEVFAVGPSDALHRTVDVGSLSSWLALRAIDRETRRLDALERSTVRPPAVTPPAAPPPAVAMTPPAESAPPSDAAPPTSAIPGPEVPLPGSDPRRAAPKPKAPVSQAPANPQASNASPGPHAAPLPPPIEIRPAPNVRSTRPRAPLIIAPPAPIPARPGF